MSPGHTHAHRLPSPACISQTHTHAHRHPAPRASPRHTPTHTFFPAPRAYPRDTPTHTVLPAPRASPRHTPTHTVFPIPRASPRHTPTHTVIQPRATISQRHTHAHRHPAPRASPGHTPTHTVFPAPRASPGHTPTHSLPSPTRKPSLGADEPPSVGEPRKLHSPASSELDQGRSGEGRLERPFFAFRPSREWKFPSCDSGQHPQCRVSGGPSLPAWAPITARQPELLRKASSQELILEFDFDIRN
ncbi:putative uncharacterized protein DDB_G0290521 isoform X2 [Sorex araneus]|uniref:putative uncharacterized protein DDB_G0290521 isoform X2 n=1 Tax=Sorex araneus TaxID=42254 RepID=UPI002433ED43|nr:putative uncharacterized protein DDB_G0290521 isoform X2 [Sorex araneus]